MRVCPGHCFAEEGDPGINNTRLCCSGPSFRRGGRKQKTRASLIRAFASKGGGNLRRGKDLKNKHPQNLSGPLLRGGGWRKQKPAQHVSGHRRHSQGEP